MLIVDTECDIGTSYSVYSRVRSNGKNKLADEKRSSDMYICVYKLGVIIPIVLSANQRIVFQPVSGRIGAFSDFF